MNYRMDEAGKPGAEETSICHLCNDTITDILLRLPAKSVLCAGAVCKAWRRITTNTSFLAEHARLQPADVVLYTYQFSRCRDLRRGYFEDEFLDLLSTSSSSSDEAARRRLIGYPDDGLFLLASCNGVLLLQKSGGTFLLCNPTTRQWSEFPRLDPVPKLVYDSVDEYAFYYHEPSGEYRLLLLRQRRWWLILSTGRRRPRHVDLDAGLPVTMGITNLLRTTPVALDGRLHWPPCQAGASTSTTKMVVFDTLSETFHLMAGPPTATADQTKVFDMEGRLVAADFGGQEHVDLWFLEDYNAGRWELRHRAPTPWRTGARRPKPEERRPRCVAAAGNDREGTVILGNHLGLLVYNLRMRTARPVNSVTATDHSTVVSRHVFRESLEQHRSFAARSPAELGVNIFWH